MSWSNWGGQKEEEGKAIQLLHSLFVIPWLPETAAETWEFIALRLADFRFLLNWNLRWKFYVPTYDDTDGDSINIYGGTSISPPLPLSLPSSQTALSLQQRWLNCAGQKGMIALRSAARLTSILAGCFAEPFFSTITKFIFVFLKIFVRLEFN